MGKRDNGKFEKRPRDYYATIDPDAAKALLPYVKGFRVAEVCAGDGDLINLLEPDCEVTWESDIEPQNKYVEKIDATTIQEDDLWNVDLIVTNPPFTWNLLKPLLDHLPTLKPTWLLLPADVIHNKRMVPYMRHCKYILSVGRLYWMDNKVKGVDNFVWLQFVDYPCITIFKERVD